MIFSAISNVPKTRILWLLHEMHGVSLVWKKNVPNDRNYLLERIQDWKYQSSEASLKRNS